MKRNNKTWIQQLSEAYIRQALNEAGDPILHVLNSRHASRQDILNAMEDEHYGREEHIVAAIGNDHPDVARRAFEDWSFMGRIDSPIWKAAIQSGHSDIRKMAREHPYFGTHPSHQAAVDELEEMD